MDMIPIYSPQSESEAAVITSLMQAYDIDYYIRGGAFSTMYPGTVSTSLNAQMLCVDPDKVELARELLVSFMADDSSDRHAQV